MGDWFESLADTLHWNLRQPQKSLVADRQDDQSPTEKISVSSLPSTSESAEDI